MTIARWPAILLAAVILVLSACGTQNPSGSGSGSTGGDSQNSGQQKTLVIGATRELKNFARFTGAAAGGGSPGSGNNQIAKIAHNYLAVRQGRMAAPVTWHPAA